MKPTLCDTGPILAYLNRNDPFHEWAAEQMRFYRAPLLTCEAVMTEAVYFLREDDLDPSALFAMLERGALRLDFELSTAWPRLRTLMARYKQMDLADACIVAMTERWPQCQVLTLDRRDFSVYRRNDRQLIEFIAPSR